MNTDPPLLIAAYQGDVDEVRALLASGVDVDTRNENNDTTALIFAAIGGHVDVMLVLLEAGADVNASNKYGWTALHHATLSLNERQRGGDGVLLLLSAGANINAMTQYGTTPLHTAIAHGLEDIAQFLVFAGAAVNVRNTNGYSARDMARRKCPYMPMDDYDLLSANAATRRRKLYKRLVDDTPAMPSSVDEFPAQIVSAIMARLPRASDFAQARLVCRAWRNAAPVAVLDTPDRFWLE